MTRVIVQCPQQLKWQPGQHCYITLPGISKLECHPFTIVSLSQHLSYPGPNDLVLLIRACQGFTKTLADMAVKNFPSRSGSFSESNSITMTSPTGAVLDMADDEAADSRGALRAWIDGPYGDFLPRLELRYHGVFCIAGGSGITAALPWLVYVAACMRRGAQDRRGPGGDKLCRTRTLHLIWSVKHLSWIRWAERELSEALRDVMMANMPTPRKSTADVGALIAPKTLRLKISIFVTQPVSDEEMKAAMLELFLGAGVDVYNPHARVEILRGRPDYATMLPNMIDRKRNIVLSEYIFYISTWSNSVSVRPAKPKDIGCKLRGQAPGNGP
jgi:hypothetical protein